MGHNTGSMQQQENYLARAVKYDMIRATVRNHHMSILFFFGSSQNLLL